MPATEIQEHIKDIDKSGKVEKTELLEGLKKLEPKDIIDAINSNENKNAIKNLVEKPVKEAIKDIKNQEYEDLTLDQKDLLVLSAWIINPNIIPTQDNYNSIATKEFVRTKSEYKQEDMNIEKKIVDVKVTPTDIHKVIENKSFTKPMLDIKDMVSGKSVIPEEYKPQITNAINKLGKREKIKIVGCTDASLINTPNAIKENKIQFDDIKSEYTKAGGTCPSYDELSKSPQDSQNTILGYTRAMQGVLSLNLNPDQIKKVEIGNKLGQNINDPKERGFDVETSYNERVERTVWSSVYTNIYRLFGELNKQNIGWYSNYQGGHNYAIDKIQFSTGGAFAKTYEDVYDGTKDIVGDNPELEKKIKAKTTNYLNHLIYVCGGNYENGTWSSDVISDKTYFIIKAVGDKTISQEEFVQVLENKNLSILENKTISNGQSLKQYITEKNITAVYKPDGGMYFYQTTPSSNINRSERKITQQDYVLLGLYFEMKKSIK